MQYKVDFRLFARNNFFAEVSEAEAEITGRFPALDTKTRSAVEWVAYGGAHGVVCFRADL